MVAQRTGGGFYLSPLTPPLAPTFLALPANMRITPGNLNALSGFSLVEMAIVLLIMGTILGGLLTAVGQSTENTRRLEVRNKLREIEETLYGFAQVNGRLPCPADDTSTGFEDPLGGGDCTRQHGFLPNSTLGISGGVNTDGLLIDPWGNPYRYSVAVRDASDSNRAFTSAAGLSTFYNNNEISTTDMLRVCDIDDCSGAILGDVVPAIVISMGKNWADFSSANEVENGSGDSSMTGYTVTNTSDFVSAGYSEVNFDDMLTWVSPHLLFSKLITAGKLP